MTSHDDRITKLEDHEDASQDRISRLENTTNDKIARLETDVGWIKRLTVGSFATSSVTAASVLIGAQPVQAFIIGGVSAALLIIGDVIHHLIHLR